MKLGTNGVGRPCLNKLQYRSKGWGTVRGHLESTCRTEWERQRRAHSMYAHIILWCMCMWEPDSEIPKDSTCLSRPLEANVRCGVSPDPLPGKNALIGRLSCAYPTFEGEGRKRDITQNCLCHLNTPSPIPYQWRPQPGGPSQGCMETPSQINNVVVIVMDHLKHPCHWGLLLCYLLVLQLLTTDLFQKEVATYWSNSKSSCIQPYVLLLLPFFFLMLEKWQ